MEHWVTITIPESAENFTMPIFDALVAAHPEAGAVMDHAAADGPTHYTVSVDADDAQRASAVAGAMFQAALSTCRAAGAGGARIIDLHAEVAPDEGERPSHELQRA